MDCWPCCRYNLSTLQYSTVQCKACLRRVQWQWLVSHFERNHFFHFVPDSKISALITSLDLFLISAEKLIFLISKSRETCFDKQLSISRNPKEIFSLFHGWTSACTFLRTVMVLPLFEKVWLTGLVLRAHTAVLNTRRISFTCSIRWKISRYNIKNSIYFTYYLCSLGGYRIQKALSGFPFDKLTRHGLWFNPYL